MSLISEPLLQRPQPPSNSNRTYLEGNIYSKLFLTWVSDLIDIGNKATFQQSMHWNLRPDDKAHKTLDSLLKKWHSTSNPSLMRTLLGINKWTLTYGILMSFLSSIFDFSGPVFLNLIVTYVQEDNRDLQYGIILISGVILSRILQALTYGQSNLYTELTGIRFKIGINSTIYHKALRFPLIRSTEHSVGSLINNIQVDSEKIYLLAMTIGGSIVIPIQIIMGIIMLIYLVGFAFWAGLLVVVVMGIVNYFLGKIYFKFQKEVMQKKDRRIRITNEIFSGIKYIKMSGWEEIFIKKVSKARESELNSLRKQYLTNCFTIFSLWLTPMLMAVAIFGTYVFSGNTLNPANAFTIISILGLLQYPLRVLPSIIMLILEAIVSARRIEKFLKDEELQLGCLHYNYNNDSPDALKITNGNFYWQERPDTEASNRESQVQPESEENKCFSLNNINLHVKKGEFIVILGDVGSGKSSIFNAILGEMKYDIHENPRIEINGSLGYVGQHSWIQNNTLRDNITFGNPWDQKRYDEAIYYSNLEQDIAILIKGDQTEIGEKGVNLSGGQKARLSLARALYSNPDIFLLDDPLSAVDAHVGSLILKECLTDYLKGKTRILITHQFESLKYADYAYIFHNGSIIESGTYEELKHTEAFQFIEHKAKLKKQRSLSQVSEESIDEKDLIPKKHPKDTFAMSHLSLEDTIEDNEEKIIKEKLMLNEDREIGFVGFKIWKSYFQYYGGWKYFSLVTIVMLFWITLMTGSNFWLSYWANNFGTSEHSNEYFFTVYAILALTFSVFCFLRAALLFFQSIKCSRVLHKDMISRVIRAPINLFFDRIPIGRILNRYSKDLTIIDNYIASTFGSLMMSFFCFFADLFICLVAGTIWALPVIVLFGALGVYYQIRYMNVRREIIRLESISRSPMLSYFTETLNGLTSIRAFKQENLFLSIENTKNLIANSGLESWFIVRITFCTILVIVPALVLPILVFEPDPNNSAMIGLLLNYVIWINDDMLSALRLLSNFESQMISLERCKALMMTDTENNWKTTRAVENYSPVWPRSGDITFSNYFTRYRPNLPFVLQNMSLKIKDKEKIGIVGRTGSGKSTIFLALLRIIEPGFGNIVIDGVDISLIGLDDLRRKITTIPQDPMLFEGTLRDNLDLQGMYSDEQLWNALENVCLKDKFSIGEGLNSEIKDEGANLSAGEKQLLCIARAILTKNKIVLIDEATSNIDFVTETTILNTIKTHFSESTVITVAHRLKTIINCDRLLTDFPIYHRIIVMHEGQVVEFDAPSVLLNDKESFFTKLWNEYKEEQSLE